MATSRLTRNSAKADLDSFSMWKDLFGELQKNILHEFSQFRETLTRDLENFKGAIREDVDQIKQEIRTEFEQIRVNKVNLSSDTNSDTDGETDGETSEVNPHKGNIDIDFQHKLDSFIAEQGVFQRKIDTFMESQVRKSRDMNLRFAGLPEEEKENIMLKVQNLVKDKMKIETHGISGAFRVGKLSDRPRQVVVKFQSREHRLDVLKRRVSLKGTNVWINEDLTSEQYQKHKQDMTRLREARHNGQRAYWRNGKVVIEEKEKDCIVQPVASVKSVDPLVLLMQKSQERMEEYQVQPMSIEKIRRDNALLLQKVLLKAKLMEIAKES